ncbi:MAG: YitT family protein [Candidatus Cryptobacteroides sp.]
MKSFKSILKILGTGKFWSEFLLMTIAMFISAAAVYYFLVPSKLIVGSISGLSIVVAELFTRAGISIDVSTMVFIINAILLVVAYLLIDHEFGIKTVYTALILGPMIKLWECILPVESIIPEGQHSIMGDPWFDLLSFVLILSAAQAILFRINASTGGLDIVAKIFNKFFKFDMGLSVTIAGAMICLTALFINPFPLVIIGLIGTWINGLCVDYFMASLNRRKRVCLISEDHEKIRLFIIEKLQRGCSLYELKGGYSLESQVEIQALLTKTEFADLMRFISDNNIKAFITASNVSEVYGLWRGSKKQIKQ